MIITCWGSRGSIPVSGEEYVRYGGDTTCVEVRTKAGEVIVVDAGTGIRRLGNRLVEEEHFRVHLLFTHAHWDHLMGFPFFKPVFLDRARLHVHRCPFQDDFVERTLTRILSPPNFPVRYSDVRAEIAYEPSCPAPFSIGSVTVVPQPISHPNGGSGYKFIEGEKSFVFLTDNELGHAHPGGLDRKGYTEFCAGADLLIHDAEYTPEEYRRNRGWGHSAYSEVVDMALDAGVGRLGLFHLNQERSDDAVDGIVTRCRERIDRKGGRLECAAVGSDARYEL